MKVVGVDVVRASDRIVPRVGGGREGSWVTRVRIAEVLEGFPFGLYLEWYSVHLLMSVQY